MEESEGRQRKHPHGVLHSRTLKCIYIRNISSYVPRIFDLGIVQREQGIKLRNVPREQLDRRGHYVVVELARPPTSL